MRYIGKTIMIGVLIGVILIFIFMGIRVLNGRELVFDQRYMTEAGYFIMYSIVLTLINGSFFDYLNHRVVWKKYGKYRLAIGAIGGIILTMLGIFFLRIVTELGFEGESWDEFIIGEEPLFYVISLLITLVVSVFFHAFYFYKGWQEKKVKEQKIIAGTASAKFDALKNQLDPHFLFNSLNVLTSLIDEDPYMAQKFTTSLSKVYRYVLEQKNKDLVSVDEELQFARTYVRLLKMRFEDSIICNIPEKSSDPDAKIVPLSLQLLLENAVKHNVVTSSRPLQINVEEKGGSLIVSNNLQEKQVVKKSSGVGLQNIQQRYSLLTDKIVNIKKTATTFSVTLPELTKQVSSIESQETHISDKRYQKAVDKVKAIQGFYGNLTAYCFVIPFLIWLNIRTSDFPWVIFPIFGWGFGLTMHGMEAYGSNPLWGKRWEEKKIQELMKNDDF